MSDIRPVALAVAALVGIGVALRLSGYLLDAPLWWDEAFVGANLLRRGYLDLLRPLDYGQVAPLLFLWSERAAVGVLGFSAWSLRLIPMIWAVASVPLFARMAAGVVSSRALVLAVAVFAVANHPVRHAADAKPYAADLLVALVLQDLALRYLRDPTRAGEIWTLAAAAPIALLMSHPSAFVLGGVGLALMVPVWRSGRIDVRIALAAYMAVVFASALLIYAAFTQDQASASGPGMMAMWARSFPPLDSAWSLGRWLIVAHTGEMLAYPFGGEQGGSILSLALVAFGGWSLGARGRGGAVGVLLAPLIPALAAAALGKYPYGGPAPHGSAARVLQYMAPAFCLLVGVGADAAIGRIGRPWLRDRAGRWAVIGLVVAGFVATIPRAARPYRAYQAKAARDFSRRFWPEVGRGAEVASLRWDLGAAEWDSIRLGVAVALCDEAIESPSRRAGGPDWSRVSADRPLRCVLEVAPEADTPAVSAWLGRMAGRFDLRRRRTVRHDLAEPGRRPEVERFEVFEFVPRPPGRASGD